MTHDNNIPPKPIPLIVLPDAIPPELQALNQWVCWRYWWDDEDRKWTKPPLNPRTGNKASSTNQKTWTSFEFALSRYQESQGQSWQFDGIGMVLLLKNILLGLDLDHCRDPQTGMIQDWATEVVNQSQTYWEVSTSGTGLRGIGSGHKPGPRCRNDDIGFELYTSSRYLGCTQHSCRNYR